VNTRRHPRTLTEAFGPYTSHDLQPMRDPHEYTGRWWFAMGLIAIATVLAIAIFR
jgi:hypothetical protein